MYSLSLLDEADRFNGDLNGFARIFVPGVGLNFVGVDGGVEVILCYVSPLNLISRETDKERKERVLH